jgi:hypothetical protein
LAAEGWHGEETPLVIAHTVNASERGSNTLRLTTPTSSKALRKSPGTRRRIAPRSTSRSISGNMR